MAEPIRVLHCVAGLGRGGYETFIMNVYRHIDRSKVQFDFLYSFDGVFLPEILSLGGRVFQIPFITQKGPFVYHKALRDFFRAHPEYKIVHSHMDKFSGLIVECAKEFGIPVRIAHSHSTQNEGNLAFHLVKEYYGKKIAGNYTHALACSADAGRWLFGDGSNVQVVKNGVDTTLFTNADNRSGDSFVITYVASLVLQKNHTFLLDVFSQVYQRDNTARLVLAGSGPTLESLQQKAQSLGIAQAVQFLGDCSEVAQLLTTVDVFCMPSLFEGLPVSLVEAQAAAVPCVVSDQVSQEADLTGDMTFLPLSSPEVWAEALLAHKHQPRGDNREKILAAGYDIRNTAAILQDFYLHEGRAYYG